MSQAHALYRQGKLSEAITAQNDWVKSHPSDAAARMFLVELLCFDGNHPRADLIIEQVQSLDPSLSVPLALLRQLLRADIARQQYHEEARAPELLSSPSPLIRAYLQARAQLDAGDLHAALRSLAEAEELRPRVLGSHDGQAFEDFRDLDDLSPGVLEVYTSTGKFFWVAIDQIRELEFRPPQKAIDLLWRQARLVVENGPEGEVYIPSLYAGSAQSDEPSLKLGLATHWSDEECGPVRGLGQRCLLLGDADIPILELGSLIFEPVG